MSWFTVIYSSSQFIFSFFFPIYLFFSSFVPPSPRRYVVSPLTGEKVLATQLEEHLRIQLLDPKWRDQKEVPNPNFLAFF